MVHGHQLRGGGGGGGRLGRRPPLRGRRWLLDALQRVGPPRGPPPEYQTLRYARGSLSYAVPVPGPGRYRVHATFVELYHRAAGKRRSDVYVGGDGEAGDTGAMIQVATRFDAFVAAGNAGDTPVTLALPSAGESVAAAAVVRVTLVGAGGDPMISTLWVEAVDE
eukprot:TRINITY_DN2897_c0_g1_i10.p4 TRINITY_DN2897_c0_g1~~TRINITY_DN2897_c0_g1_i10.p4  ORF type:complete len:165 (+),score=54.13 TRINITY_DN2897_c0_g1_i10:577-1071(+)